SPDFSLFFFWPLLPPRSPPFPYTTLFRSPTNVNLLQSTFGLILVGFLAAATFWAGCQQGQRMESGRAAAEAARHEARADSLEAADRKSTRLNSSHVKISYAVFCLKKKKRK